MANATFPRKNGRTWSIAALVFWFIILLISTVVIDVTDVGAYCLFSSIGLIAHCLTFVRRRPVPLVASILVGVLNVAIIIMITVHAFDEFWDQRWSDDCIAFLLLVFFAIVPFCCYCIHIVAPRYFSSYVGMTWEETKALQQPNAIQRKLHLRARKKAYAQIDKYHDYLQRGVISQEEYETERRCILESLENR